MDSLHITHALEGRDSDSDVPFFQSSSTRDASHVSQCSVWRILALCSDLGRYIKKSQSGQSILQSGALIGSSTSVPSSH